MESIEEISEEEDQDDDDAISKYKMSVAEISFNDSRKRSFDEMSQDGTFHTAPDEQEVSNHILIGDEGPKDALEEMDDANVTTFQLHVEESKLNEEDLWKKTFCWRKDALEQIRRGNLSLLIMP
jgi:hypothetical protein